MNYDSEYQLWKLIKQYSDILEDVTETHKYSRSDFAHYGVYGKAGGKYIGYNTYIATAIIYDMSFVEVILYKEPEYLSEIEMKEINYNQNYHQSFSLNKKTENIGFNDIPR